MAKYQTAIKWFGVTGFIFIFQLIYNHFGHGVQSQKNELGMVSTGSGVDLASIGGNH